MVTLEDILALKDEARQKYVKASAENRQEEMVRLEALYDDLKRAEQRFRLGQLANAAAEIAGLADRLDQATGELQHKVDTMFLEDLKAAADALAEKAGTMIRKVRHHPAPEVDPDPTPVVATPAPDPNPLPVVDSPDGPPLTAKDYQACFDAVQLRDAWLDRIDGVVDLMTKPDRTIRYRRVEQMTGVPWWVVCIIHMLEASANFKLHLHNGDPLSAPTVRVPAGRPESWRVGMTWAESAADALIGAGRSLGSVTDWSVGSALEVLERYNGLGYRKRGRMSPYLWSGSEYFDKGKYVADGKFDPNAVSQQVGAACLLKRMIDRDLVTLSAQRKVISVAPAGVLGSTDMATLDLSPFPHAAKEIDFPGTHNQHFGKGTVGMTARRIQEWCDLHGISTAIDDDFGEGTLKSVSRFQQRNALPVTGEVDRETWLLLTAPMRRALMPATVEADLNATYLKIARQHIAQTPQERAGQNRGPWVRLYMKGREGDAQLWCAGFVSTLAAQAARDMGIKMPFKRQVSCDQLVKDAKAAGRFLSEAAVRDANLRPSKILPGMLFVIRKSANDWNHVGIVSNANRGDFDTIEGNTNGSNNNGGEAKASTRNYVKKDFIRLV
ncbi:peptidoglycan-binding protein [uncultured Tateyamaria sp.]|uniref:peptidoglycan-binding protein n=1 Tax=uncultured Tateyamaria sp. TaxID=455651 RepID=UPI0026365E72|nr:peptidoglycan-binding protein [uncultured Tateyamaria sp.]